MIFDFKRDWMPRRLKFQRVRRGVYGCLRLLLTEFSAIVTARQASVDVCVSV